MGGVYKQWMPAVFVLSQSARQQAALATGRVKMASRMLVLAQHYDSSQPLKFQ